MRRSFQPAPSSASGVRTRLLCSLMLHLHLHPSGQSCQQDKLVPPQLANLVTRFGRTLHKRAIDCELTRVSGSLCGHSTFVSYITMESPMLPSPCSYQVAYHLLCLLQHHMLTEYLRIHRRCTTCSGLLRIGRCCLISIQRSQVSPLKH